MTRFVLIFSIWLIAGAGVLKAQTGFKIAEPDSVISVQIMSTDDYFWQSGWNYSSVDRISLKLNTGDYGFYGPQPVFLLDGIPFDPSFFGVTYSQFFPVSYDQSQNIELKKGAGVAGGVSYQTGVMQIMSEQLKDGISVSGSAQYGHNSGEPGPWVFSPDFVSPNVERFGPWLNGGLSLKFGNWYAKSLLKYQIYKHIDEFVQLRLINSRQSPTENNVWLGVDAKTTLALAETGFDSQWVTLKFQGYHAESEDFLYFQPFAREVPAGFNIRQYSALANVQLHERMGLRTLYQYREQGLDYHMNRFEYDFDWQRQMHSARASLFFDSNRYSADLGGEWEQTEAKAAGLGEDNRIVSTLFLKQDIAISSFMRVDATAQLQMMDSEMAAQAGGALQFKLAPAWSMNTGVSYTELFPEMANPLEQQVQNGYYIFDHLGIPFSLPDQIENTKKLAYSNSHRFKISENTKIGLEFELIRHLSLNIPFQPAEYELQFSTLPGTFELFSGATGKRLHAGLNVSFTPVRNMDHRVAISANRTLDGDKNYKNYWDMVPEYLVQYSFDYRPFPDVNIMLNVQYRSAARWSEFENLDGELNRTFHVQYPFRFFEFSDTLPQHINIDLKLGKWFWEQRLRGVLLLKNLLNSDYQTHPLGVRERFGYMARAELRF